MNQEDKNESLLPTASGLAVMIQKEFYIRLALNDRMSRTYCVISDPIFSLTFLPTVLFS